jgi:serine/threonine-protein kinase RsbW
VGTGISRCFPPLHFCVRNIDIDILDVKVSDRGRWRPSMRASASVPDALRGRGIPLMRVLADDVRIDTSERGTQVSLTWARLLKPSNRPASG